MDKKKKNERELVVPIIHVHTHPDGNPYTSRKDLLNAKERSEAVVELGGALLKFSNPTLNLIIGASPLPGNSDPARHNFTFYQLTNGKSAVDDFVREYDRQHTEAQAETSRASMAHDDTKLTRNFMDRLETAGVCKYLHFPANSPKSLFRKGADGISKKDLDKITSTFAYKIGVEKTRLKYD